MEPSENSAVDSARICGSRPLDQTCVSGFRVLGFRVKGTHLWV